MIASTGISMPTLNLKMSPTTRRPVDSNAASLSSSCLKASTSIALYVKNPDKTGANIFLEKYFIIALMKLRATIESNMIKNSMQ